MQTNDLHKLRRSTMKTAAIIAEYNPFHNGHKYQIEETRRRTGADFIAVVMSGDFVQRGAPAIYSKGFSGLAPRFSPALTSLSKCPFSEV